jgi:hypothetical protein
MAIFFICVFHLDNRRQFTQKIGNRFCISRSGKTTNPAKFSFFKLLETRSTGAAVSKPLILKMRFGNRITHLGPIQGCGEFRFAVIKADWNLHHPFSGGWNPFSALNLIHLVGAHQLYFVFLQDFDALLDVIWFQHNIGRSIFDFRIQFIQKLMN